MKSKWSVLLVVLFSLLGSYAFSQSRFNLLDRWAYGIQNQIHFIGDIGYLNSGATLVVADFSDTLNPVVVNEIVVGNLVESFITVDDYLYIADRYQLWIFNIADPSNPLYLDKMDLVEPVQKWYYHEDHLYQIGKKKIIVYSLADRSAPELLSSIGTEQTMWHLIFKDSLVFAAARYYNANYILSMDLHDWKNPVIKKNVIAGSTYINAIGLFQNHLVAGGGGKVYFIHMEDSAYFSIDHSFDVGFVYDFYSKDSMLFIARQGYGVDCFDMSDIHDPRYEGNIDYWAEKMVFHGRYLFLTSDYFGDVVAYNLDNLLHPLLVSHIVFGGFNYYLEISSGFAFIPQDDRVVVLDISDPSNLEMLVSIPTSESRDIEISDDLLFISEGDLGWSIFDITNILTPELLASMSTGSRVNELAVSGEYLYLAAGNEGVQIYDISDPTNPVEAGRFSNGNYFEKVYPIGKYLYVFEDGLGIRVLDVSDKFNPEATDLVEIKGSVRSMISYDTYLYLGINGDSRILDISDPAHPFDLELIFFWQNPLDLFIENEVLYVTELSRGLYLYDISDPTSPVFMDRYDFPFAASRVYVKNEVIYLLDQLSGLTTLHYGVTTSAEINDFHRLFEVYPNPATDWIRVDFDAGQKIVFLTIRNLEGKILMRRELMSELTGISLSTTDFSPGVYLVTVDTGQDRQTEKLIIQ